MVTKLTSLVCDNIKFLQMNDNHHYIWVMTMSYSLHPIFGNTSFLVELVQLQWPFKQLFNIQISTDFDDSWCN